MRLPFTSVSSDHDGRLVAVDKNGEVFKQEREHGKQTCKWRRLELNGLSPKIPRQVHCRFDGSLVVTTVDGYPYEFVLTGGSYRYGVQGEWRKVPLDVVQPVPA